MTTVIRFPRHKWHRCSDHRCFVCEGGLAACEVCKGAEIELPTDCPGKPMAFWQKEAIAKGLLDYRFGKGWVILRESSDTSQS